MNDRRTPDARPFFRVLAGLLACPLLLFSSLLLLHRPPGAWNAHDWEVVSWLVAGLSMAVLAVSGRYIGF